MSANTRGKKIRRSLLVALVVLMLVSLGSYVTMTSPEETLAEEQVLKVGVSARDIPNIDPAWMTIRPLHMLYGVFNGLVRYPVGDQGNIDGIEPDLAKDWEVSEDGKVWTFYLREGVQFHHGYGEFTAEDVKFNFERQEGKAWGSEYEGIDKIEVIDDYTVKFTLKEADIFFLPKLTNYHGGMIVSKKAVEELGKKFQTQPVGTGPFQVKDYKPGDKYVFVRNENYWRGKPILEKIEYIFMPSVSSRTLALEKGDIDMSTGPFKAEWVERMENAGLTVYPRFSLGQQEWLHFNMTRPPLNKLKVRQALSYALCREGLDALWGTQHESHYGFVPPYAYGYIPDEEIPEKYRYECNPEKAKELLAEAGYPDGFNLGRVIASEASDEVPAVQVFQEQLRKVGVNFDIVVVDHSTMHTRIRQDVNPVVWYNAARPPYATVYLRHWFHSDSIVGTPKAITNFSHYGEVDADGDGKVADNRIDSLIEAAEEATSLEEYAQLVREAQLQLHKDVPAFPMGMDFFPNAHQPWVKLGYEPKRSMVYSFFITENTAILEH